MIGFFSFTMLWQISKSSVKYSIHVNSVSPLWCKLFCYHQHRFMLHHIILYDLKVGRLIRSMLYPWLELYFHFRDVRLGWKESWNETWRLQTSKDLHGWCNQMKKWSCFHWSKRWESFYPIVVITVQSQQETYNNLHSYFKFWDRWVLVQLQWLLHLASRGSTLKLACRGKSRGVRLFVHNAHMVSCNQDLCSHLS